MKLIVGLGNPGNEYKNTRHNVGFMAIDHYVGDVMWKSKFNGLYCDKVINGEKVLFLKPTTYMNLSGNCVVEFVNFYKINSDDILVIQDDLDLPFLKFKLKYKSSCGGHNGMRSIINCLGTDKISRLKIGIAHDRTIDTKDYVLGKINKNDLNKLNDSCKIFDMIIDSFVQDGIDKTMMKYNTK